MTYIYRFLYRLIKINREYIENEISTETRNFQNAARTVFNEIGKKEMRMHSKDIIILNNSCCFGVSQGWPTNTNDNSNFRNNVMNYLQCNILKNML